MIVSAGVAQTSTQLSGGDNMRRGGQRQPAQTPLKPFARCYSLFLVCESDLATQRMGSLIQESHTGLRSIINAVFRLKTIPVGPWTFVLGPHLVSEH